MNDRIFDTDSETIQFERSLRPRSFSEVIGRKNEIDNLTILIKAAAQRNEALDHILLHGPPGLGKTSLAHVIANEAGVPIYTTSGPAIERKADLASILTNMEDKAILFIDEIHRLNRALEEILYSAMEDKAIDIIIGKGPSARTLKLDLSDITVIGATTRVSMLSAPLRDRFGIDLKLEYYDTEDLKLLVQEKAKILQITIEEFAAEEIAKRARKTPRIAQKILKRVRDMAQVENENIINLATTKKVLTMLGVDENGLDRVDQKILHTIKENFEGGPVGLTTLAAALSEDVATLQDVYEPFLLQEGFISRTPRGRIVTDKCLKYLANSL